MQDADYRYSDEAREQRSETMTGSTERGQRMAMARNPYDSEPPHDADAERALLGACLLEQAGIDEAATVLRGGWQEFWLERHGKLWASMVAMHSEGLVFDATTLQQRLDRDGGFDALGGMEFLGELLTVTPSYRRVSVYAQRVHDTYVLRQLASVAHKTIQAAYEPGAELDAVLSQASAAIGDVCGQSVRREAVQAGTLVDAFIGDLAQDAVPGLRTGFFAYDNLTGGLQPSELVVLAGRPGMGKTALLLAWLYEVAAAGTPALLFSLEMSEREVAHRLVSSMARVHLTDLRRHDLDDQQRDALTSAQAQLAGMPLWIDDSAALSVGEIRARARVAQRRHDIGCVLVDYLQLARSDSRHRNREQEVAEVSRGLKALAKDLDIPVVVGAQLNRQVEDRADQRPRLADLRESGAIEQDADVVAMLARDRKRADALPEDAPRYIAPMLALIAKQRNGPTGEVSLDFDKRFTRFENPGGAWEPPPQVDGLLHGRYEAPKSNDE